MSKYLEFQQEPNGGKKTEFWGVYSKSRGTCLGWIHWYGPWRQYCFSPAPDTVFNSVCMTDISAKIKELMDARRAVKGV